MTRVAFVQNLAFEYLGVMTLAAGLKAAGHDTEVFILENSDQDLIGEIVSYEPNIVAFSVTTGNHIWSVKFAKKLKLVRPSLTIFGGPHPTFFPELIHEESVDIICRGEGDRAIVEICNNIRDGLPYEGTLNCSFKKEDRVVANPLGPLINDLDTLPTPVRSIYREKYQYVRKSSAAFMAGRGCPYDCSFCFNHAAKQMYRGLGRYVRLRSPDNVVEEIYQAATKFNLRSIYLQDDTILLSKKWIRKFIEGYRDRVGLPLVCLVRADQIDEETIVLLKSGGLKNVFFGIETGDEGLRMGLLKKRGITDQSIRRAATILRRHRVGFRTYNMVGLPTETLEQAFTTMQLNQEIKTDYPWCSIFTPFPGTELQKVASDMDFMNSFQEIDTASFFRRSILDIPDSDSFSNLQKLFFFGVRFPLLTNIIKKLVKYRPNKIYDLLFLMGYGFCLWRSENMTIRDVVSTGFRNLSQFFSVTNVAE